MKKVICGIIILILLCTGVFTQFIEFILWLFVLKNSTPELSIVGNIIVRLLTFVISFGLVGVIFDIFGHHNGRSMKLSYFIISSLVGFALSFVVWKIEQYIVTILIIFSVVFTLALSYIIFEIIKNKRVKV